MVTEGNQELGDKADGLCWWSSFGVRVHDRSRALRVRFLSE